MSTNMNKLTPAMKAVVNQIIAIGKQLGASNGTTGDGTTGDGAQLILSCVNNSNGAEPCHAVHG